jgi:cytochrome c-type biogenesis protein CcmE
MRRRRLLLGGSVIVLALGFLVLTGIRQSVVYFVTPSELTAARDRAPGQAYRLGGMVVQGSLARDPATREHRFLLTDGKASVPVYHRGIPPDLFGEGRGAVVEGTLGADGTFQAATIMAKHSEEYRAPDGTVPDHEQLLKTLRTGAGSSGSP